MIWVPFSYKDVAPTELGHPSIAALTPDEQELALPGLRSRFVQYGPNVGYHLRNLGKLLIAVQEL
jgi:hypothetical protein